MTTPREHAHHHTTHAAVLLHEAIALLDIQANDVVLDCTVGGGGHAQAICALLGPAGRYIGIDADRTALARVAPLFEGDTRVTLVCGNYRDAAQHLQSAGLMRADKLLADLGLSSDQLVTPAFGMPRGFSFERDEPLAMTLSADPEQSLVTARTVINEWSEESLADIIFGFGGERRARRVAHAIVEAREREPIETSGALARVIHAAIGKGGRRDSATRTFQAVRMAVNDELGSLQSLLAHTPALLGPNGRAVFISFHSLEDGAVKRAMRAWAQDELGVPLSKKPVTPSQEECAHNPRARSAKLRAFLFT